MRVSRSFAAVVGVVGLVAGGCGPRVMPDPPKTYLVKGKILLPNRQPLSGGRLTFTPRSDKPSALEGFAEIEPDGSFKASLFTENGGLPPGIWLVTISPHSQYGGIPRTVHANQIPKKFMEENFTPWTIEVKNQDVEQNLVLN